MGDYLATEYFPRGLDVHGVRAAFATEGIPVSPGMSIWRLPRYVFRHHWKTQDDLRHILGACK